MSIKEDIEKVEKKMKRIEEESLAMELLKDARKTNKRIFVILIIVLVMWFSTIGAFLYYINTTGMEETYTEQTVEDVESISDTNIVNGDMYGENMVKALEDFIQVLYEEAETQEQKQQLMQTLQKSMQM